MIVRFAIAFLLVAVLLILGVQNPQPVQINFLTWRAVPMSVLVIVLASVLVGLLGGFLMGWHPRDEPVQDEEASPEKRD